MIINVALHARERALGCAARIYIFEPFIGRDSAAGRLTQVLHHAAIKEPNLFLYSTCRATMADKLLGVIVTAKDVSRPTTISAEVER